MFGCIPGGGKSKKHALAPNEDMFCNLLLDIYQHVTPNLNIMDAIIGLEGDGPGSAGIPKKAGLILASKDAVALDIEASKIIGYDPLDIKIIKYAIERGIFSKLEDVEVIGEKNLKINFKKPTMKNSLSSKLPKPIVKLIFNFVSLKPHVKKNKCKKCNICADVCPVDAIKLSPYPKFNRKKCVLCYCCHENCPYNAINLSYSNLVNFLNKIRNIFGKRG